MDVSLRVVDGCVIHDKADICTRVKLANDVTYKRYAPLLHTHFPSLCVICSSAIG